MAELRQPTGMGTESKRREKETPRCERQDGSLHSKSFAHTDKGMYFMGMTLMNYKTVGSLVYYIYHFPYFFKKHMSNILLYKQ